MSILEHRLQCGFPLILKKVPAKPQLRHFAFCHDPCNGTFLNLRFHDTAVSFGDINQEYLFPSNAFACLKSFSPMLIKTDTQELKLMDFPVLIIISDCNFLACFARSLSSMMVILNGFSVILSSWLCQSRYSKNYWLLSKDLIACNTERHW